MHEIVTIWLKELRDTVRDRRTLVSMVLVPIVVTPLLFVGLNALARATAGKPVRVAVDGGASAPGVVEALRRQPRVLVARSADPAAAIKDGKADAGLILGAGFAARVAQGGAGQATIVEDSTQTSSSRAVAAVAAALEGYRAVIVTGRLRTRGVDPASIQPVATVTRDVATKQALAGFLLSLLVPAFLVIYAMIGGMYTAMDISAGEKERSTLEALLLSPATKLQITLGKLLAVSTVSLGTIVLALIALFVSLQRAPLDTGSGAGVSASLSLPAGAVALIVFLGVLLAVSLSALELTLSIFARSFKEAQSYIMPLYFVVLLPTYALGFIPGLKLALGFYLIPVVNTVLVFKDVLVGTTTAAHVALTIGTMLVFCLVCVLVTLRIFGDERVLLRS